MTRETLKFEIGGCWEYSEWEIRFDEPVTEFMGVVPCPHAGPVRKRDDWEQSEWVVPRVVVMHNEAGYNTTGICLDCVLEAVKTL